MDLNHRPSGYEPDELPDCSIPRCVYNYNGFWVGLTRGEAHFILCQRGSLPGGAL